MSNIWKYAIVQHPMWLIIAEDSVCGERTPPWGTESIGEYACRLEKSLESVRKFPTLHLNFDFSAVELEELYRTYPAIGKQIRELVSQGRISFVNGTYSQPHLQILSVNSAIRQFEYGLEAIGRLTGYRVRCYAAQEPGLTPQLPQILRSFGYESVSTPSFPFGVKLFGGEIEHWKRNWIWLAGDDLVEWRGMDGTRIPMWLKTSGYPDDDVRADDEQHGLMHYTRFRVDLPDMVEITPEWIANREKHCEFVQLDRTLGSIFEQWAPSATAEIDANYAYLEGVDAEELARANTRAETALLSLEAVEFLMTLDSPFDYGNWWKTLLKAQHHDSYWVGAPELREKSIRWLDSVAQAAHARLALIAQEIGKGIAPPPEGRRAIVMLHPYPRPHKLPVSIRLSEAAIIDPKRNELPAQTKKEPDGSSSLLFIARGQGTGYETLFPAHSSRPARTTTQGLRESYRFANRFYTAVIRPDATIQHLALRGRPSILRGPGNLWTFLTENGYAAPEPDCDLTQLEKGPVFDAVESGNRLGPADIRCRIELYHELPWFNVEVKLRFNEPSEIGDYFDDRTKLHHSWSVGKEMRIRHALGGCPVDARPNRWFFVNPWLDLADSQGGIAFCLFNASKCWLDDDGCLRFLVAWGHNGDRFHNRMGPIGSIMGPLNWIKSMDLRLRGTYTVRYAVWPHSRRISDFDIADWAASLLMPPLAFSVESGAGESPWSQTVVSLQTRGLLPISLRPGNRKGEVILRVMETAGRKQQIKIDLDPKWRFLGTHSLDGTNMADVNPYRIVEILFGKLIDS